ncbi:hypothetical protein DRN84_03070 [Candidatus Geothermarchaeota archaeon]|nr:MAG: hypothetical protein DRN84_03070 [Candidatus Geothermarchaeota archaeon]
MNIYHELDKNFDGKLRHYSIERTTARLRGEEVTFSEGIAYIDAVFNLEIFDHLHEPNLIGIERILSSGEVAHIIFEVVGVRPRHYEMPSLTPDVPPVLKWEYLDNIGKSWLSGGENWMEIIAVHTGYMMKVKDDNLVFEKTKLSPLAGSRAHILSQSVIKEMVCKEKSEKYVDVIGTLIGYNIELSVDLYSLFKYHTGFFGFTGSGKSNLISFLIRKLLDKIPDLKVVIFDISGEYTVHLIDKIVASKSPVYTNEAINNERFADSQVIPETLSSIDGIENKIKELLKEVNLNLIEAEKSVLTIGMLINYLGEIPDKYPYLIRYYDNIKSLLRKLDKSESFVKVLNKEENRDLREQVVDNLVAIKNGLSQRSGLATGITHILQDLSSEYSEEEKEAVYHVDAVVNDIVNNKGYPQLTVFYIPDPLAARKIASDFINIMFSIKKFKGVGNKVLVVFDEAQEFIPDRVRTDDYTYQSNIAVEMLLRQGRKYLVGGWIATQRLAHLNTNALQQLHSYFISTLPRSYDRNVVSDAFSVSRSVIDKVTELDTGEWIFVSYKATKTKNIPVEIKTPNNEDILIKKLSETDLT